MSAAGDLYLMLNAATVPDASARSPSRRRRMAGPGSG